MRQLHAVRIVRRFPVRPEVVFDVLTNPESMPLWWGEHTTFEIDLRVGGSWTAVRREDDTEYVATGEYLEIARPSRLVYTYSMPQFSPNSDTLSFDIVTDDRGSVVTFEHAGEDIASELRDLAPGAVSESEKGWQQGFDLMAAAWAEQGHAR